MANDVYIERRKRGFFGWLFLLIFIIWNVLMLIWLITAGAGVNDVIQSAGDSEAGRAGATIGAGIGFIFILFVWAMGAVVTGLLALLTRGSKTVVTRRR